MSVDWVGYGYATLIASGGVIGYVKAGELLFKLYLYISLKRPLSSYMFKIVVQKLLIFKINIIYPQLSQMFNVDP